MKEPSPLRSISRRLARIYSEERVLFGVGLLGIVLGLIALSVMAVRGRFIPPEGYVYKAASFDIAIGIYVLTLILLIPLAGFTRRGRTFWRWWSVGLALYAYAVENIQIYRGLDPRFTRHGSAVDNIAGIVFGGSALGLITMFLILTWRFFGERSAIKDRLLLVGIRYGCVSVILGFAVGFLLGANQGPRVGSSGNLLPLHAAGFHGLQAVPLVALILGWARVPEETARRWVHAAGIAWLGACAGVAWQTARGQSVLEISAATILALGLFTGWLLCAVMASLAWKRAGGVLKSA